MNFSVHNLINILLFMVLSVFGVCARELRYKDEIKFTIAKAVSDMVVAAFGATIVYFIASMSNIPEQMGYILSGLVGWGGPEIIDRIFKKTTDI